MLSEVDIVSGPDYSESSLKDLILMMAQMLVDKPDEVEVLEIKGHMTSVLELKVDKDDLGKVIGREGRTARAMRLILTACSTKLHKRALLEIIE